MKLIEYAIGSIVHANTGSGLSVDRLAFGSAAGQASGDRHRRGIFSAMAAIGGNAVAALADLVRDYAARQRQIRQLAGLNDHLLRDIGLHRGNVSALQHGQIGLDELEAERNRQIPPSGRRILRPVATGALGLDGFAANDAADAANRCA